MSHATCTASPVGAFSNEDGAAFALALAAGSADALTLYLPLTHHWYDETERGAKCVEYRVMIPRWEKQIWQRRDRITHVRFSRGYTSRTLTRPVEKIDIGQCPIPGWSGEYYRIHFLPNAEMRDAANGDRSGGTGSRRSSPSSG